MTIVTKDPLCEICGQSVQGAAYVSTGTPQKHRHVHCHRDKLLTPGMRPLREDFTDYHSTPTPATGDLPTFVHQLSERKKP